MARERDDIVAGRIDGPVADGVEVAAVDDRVSVRHDGPDRGATDRQLQEKVVGSKHQVGAGGPNMAVIRRQPGVPIVEEPVGHDVDMLPGFSREATSEAMRPFRVTVWTSLEIIRVELVWSQ